MRISYYLGHYGISITTIMTCYVKIKCYLSIYEHDILNIDIILVIIDHDSIYERSNCSYNNMYIRLLRSDDDHAMVPTYS